MKKKHLLFFTRLDIHFKMVNYVREVKGPITPIREHWQNFCKLLTKFHDSIDEPLFIFECPLWCVDEFTKNQIDEWAEVFSSIYIPHRNDFELPLLKYNKKLKVKYYMQMVFPWLFQVDSKGWGPTSSIYPINYNESSKINKSFIDLLRKRQKNGESKFEQPLKLSFLEKDYVLFICQIPNDLAIKYHSNGVSVLEAIKFTESWCRHNNKKLIIRGHPVSPQSMDSIKKSFPENKFNWQNNININDLLENSKIVVTIGSGVGMEALLFNKQVVIFGQADYDSMVLKANRINYDFVFKKAWNLSSKCNNEATKNKNEKF